MLLSERKSFDGFEVWDGPRVVFSYPDAAKKPEDGHQEPL